MVIDRGALSHAGLVAGRAVQGGELSGWVVVGQGHIVVTLVATSGGGGVGVHFDKF